MNYYTVNDFRDGLWTDGTSYYTTGEKPEGATMVPNDMRIDLPIKFFWLERICFHGKKEEYRECSGRNMGMIYKWKERIEEGLFPILRLRAGYDGKSRCAYFKVRGIRIGRPNPEWWPKGVPVDNTLIIEIGERIK